MRWWRELIYLLRRLKRRRAEQELDEEIQTHLQLEIEEQIEAGMSPEEARYAALRAFGSVALAKEESRAMWGFRSLETLWQDLRYGMRVLLKWPGFSFIVLLILALGIGATSAIFSVVNAVLLRPLPYPDPDRLVMVFATDDREAFKTRIGTASGPDFLEWRDQNQVFEQMAAYSGGSWPVSLSGGGEPGRAHASRVTSNFFSTLSVQPLLGRAFLPEEKGRSLFAGEGQPDSDTVVLISYGLWQSRFGGDPTLVGKAVKVEGDNCTVVGIMPAGFQFPGGVDLWLPATVGAKRDNATLWVIGRLKSGVTREQAQAEMATIARRLEQQFPETNRGTGINIVPLHEYLVGDVRPALMVFLGAVCFVLLIACSNVANLLLARAVTRQKEVAVRMALGAGRLRLIRQLLTESALLSLLAGGLGLLLAFWLLRVLLAFMPQTVPRLHVIGIDQWVLGFTVLVSLFTGMAFGLAPALQISKPKLNEALKEGSLRPLGPVRHRLRALLVVSEIALALVLLIGAGLLIKSFMLLRGEELGFNPENLLTVGITLPESTYRTGRQVKAYSQQALERIATLPEVRAAAVTSSLPLGKSGARIQGDFTAEGELAPRPGLLAHKIAVSPDYFHAMGIPLLKGRAFTERDTEQSPGVLIISETLARRLWPNDDPLGKRLNIGFRGETWREIVGVVGDVKQDDLGAAPTSAIYQPYLQTAASRRWMISEMSFTIRTASDPEGVVTRLRSEFQAIDKDLPLYDVAPMKQVVSEKVSDPRFYTMLLGAFSALALVLAAAGIYGVISYSVTQRTHEIGIRIALGARGVDVVNLVVGQGVKLALVGVATGLAGAFAVTRVLSSFLYKVSATDPVTFSLIALLLTAVALLASYIPARRATKVDPMIALRYE